MSKNTTLHSVGLLSRPMSSASISPFLNLICIIRDIYPDAHVITVHDANSHIDGYLVTSQIFCNLPEPCLLV